MRLSRLLAVPAVALAISLAPADDKKDARPTGSADFLSPHNWEGLKEYWSVEGDTVVGKADKDPGFNTFFCSKRKYADFEMSFQVQLKDAKGNSGVQVRSTVVDPKKFVVAGPQCDVGAQYWGSLYGERVGGMMKAAPIDLVKKTVRPADFNDYHILVKGNHVTIKVNGETTVDADFETTPDKKPMPAEGVIAFQLHAGGPMTVTFKGIKFKELGKGK